MKFNGRLSLILAAAIVLAGFASSALADTVAITIEKWTTNFGALSATSGKMIVDETDGSVQSFGSLIIWGSGSASDPFYVSGASGPLDYTVIFGLDSTSTGSSLLSSNVDVNKHSATDTSSYWLKAFVEKQSTSPASPGFSNPGSSGSLVTATTTYSQTTGSGIGTGSLMKSSIMDTGGSASLGSATIPNGSIVTGSSPFLRTASVYDIKQEYDIAFNATKGAHVEAHMSTTTVPEPITIVSTLIGLLPLGLMVRSFRRRKSDV